MNKQVSLSALSDELAQVQTKKKEFLSQIDRIIPWGEWVKIIKPCYYKGERGNKPYDLELMLRLYVLENLYTLLDEGTVAEAMDSRAFSELCGVESSNQVPNGDTLGRFHNLLLCNGLQEKLFAQVVELHGKNLHRNDSKPLCFFIHRLMARLSCTTSAVAKLSVYSRFQAGAACHRWYPADGA